MLITNSILNKRNDINVFSGAFIINFEHISHLFLVFLSLTLNRYMLAGLQFQNFVRVLVGKKENFLLCLETLSYCAFQLWTLLSEKFNQTNSSIFKSDLRQWICNDCPCRLCEISMPNLGLRWTNLFLKA